MKALTRTLVAAAALTFLVGITTATAQQATPPAQDKQAPAAKAMTATGELVKVDTDAHTISIKSADGVETQFAYNEQTQVKGAREGVAGLATKAGSKVTVTYTGDGATKTATSIEVQAAK